MNIDKETVLFYVKNTQANIEIFENNIEKNQKDIALLNRLLDEYRNTLERLDEPEKVNNLTIDKVPQFKFDD